MVELVKLKISFHLFLVQNYSFFFIRAMLYVKKMTENLGNRLHSAKQTLFVSIYKSVDYAFVRLLPVLFVMNRIEV